jgi:hypothetical protein
MPRRPSFVTLALTSLALIAAMSLTGCSTAGSGGGVAGIAGPGGTGTGVGPGTTPPSSFNTVVYSLSLTGVSTITSVSYDDGSGNLVTVSNPSSGWTVSVPVTRGASSVEAHARGTLPGRASATLRASWQLPGQAPENEVETETNLNATQTQALTLDVRKRAL